MEEKKDLLAETKKLLAEIMEEDSKDGLYEQEKEWMFQFDDDEPGVFTDVYYNEKKLSIEIKNTDAMVFTDGKGKTFKIFAREKK